MKPESFRDFLLSSCLFLSGSAGLIYEICWIRKTTLVLGSTTAAVSTVLAIFFLGLALGSYLFGKLAQLSQRPLRLFAMLEIALAFLGAMSPYLIDLADPIYSYFYGSFSESASSLMLIRVVVLIVLLLPPAILMGGPLPVFCRFFIRQKERIAGSVGFFYGLNTLGAVLGCVLTGIVLIPELGVTKAVTLAAAVNLLCGFTALIAGRNRECPPVGSGGLVEDVSPRLQLKIALLFFFCGFVALGYEVVWTRYLALLIRNTVLTYSLMLSVVLAGIVIGSVLASLFYERFRSHSFLFGLFQGVNGITVIGIMLLPPSFWVTLEGSLRLYFLLFLPPAILSGATFPLAIRMVVSDPLRVSGGLGKMAAVNTLGGIAGALLIGYIILPRFGLQSSLTITTGISVLVGLAGWWWISGSRSLLYWRIALSLIVPGLWMGIPLILDTRIPSDFLGMNKTLVDYLEGRESNLAVVEDQGILQLEMNNLWQGQDRKSHQIMAAHVPMCLLPNARDILTVGVGAGQTPSRFLMYDIRKLDCIDIEPGVFELIRQHFPSAWMTDPRTTLLREDGRHYILHAQNIYDVISLEVGQVFQPGVASFYTADFYRRAKQRLNQDGLLVQFVPLPFFSTEMFQNVIFTFLESFPQSILWYNTAELLLIGKNGAFQSLDPQRFDTFISNAAVREDLSYAHWGPAEYRLNQRPVFWGGLLSGPAGLREVSQAGRLLTDDHPVLDYATCDVPVTETFDISNIRFLERHLDAHGLLDPGSLSNAEIRRIRQTRAKNVSDIKASAYLRVARYDENPRSSEAGMNTLTLAYQANPESGQVNRMLGGALMSAGQFAQADPYLRQALSCSPDDAELLNALAFSLHNRGQLEAAIDFYKKSLHQNPDKAEAHSNLGAALAQKSELHDAQFHFQEALRLDPSQADAQRNLTHLKQILKSPEQP